MEIREIKRINNAVVKILQQPSYVGTSHETQPFAIATITREGNISFFSPELAGGTAQDRDQFVLANIKDIETFDDIIHLDSFKKQFAQINDGVAMCAKNCEYYQMCGGGSPSNKFTENGTFASDETQYCALQQKMLTEIFIEKMSIKEFTV